MLFRSIAYHVAAIGAPILSGHSAKVFSKKINGSSWIQLETQIRLAQTQVMKRSLEQGVSTPCLTDSRPQGAKAALLRAGLR